MINELPQKTAQGKTQEAEKVNPIIFHQASPDNQHPPASQNHQGNKDVNGNCYRSYNQSISPQMHFTPLKQPLVELHRQLHEDRDLILPPQMPPPYEVKDKIKWCEWNRHYHHTTQNYVSLKNQVENLIEKGLIKVVKLGEPIKEAN
ncbi:hypothetical protein AMTR_s00144p00049550 [Amborella trichopoda]|uniref:Uncharacterized protein n=1 Tax=Amborella trichopoda TaxID=13333 RepID=W1P7K8_AMBTC|nr:hypothetical protein AMTR_s00144p00049550 [Amborella trichopoda]